MKVPPRSCYLVSKNLSLYLLELFCGLTDRNFYFEAVDLHLQFMRRHVNEVIGAFLSS